MQSYLKMAAMDLFLFLLSSSFLLCVSNNLCHASKLNVPKLLLPYYSQAATNFTLEASDGCFIWRSSRPEVASVRPLGTSDPLGCSRTAVVTSVSTVPTRRTTIVTAEESVTGQELRCDVIIDEIKDIHIETTTKELFLDDSPEEFVIRASNDKDDMFSSLDGMLFDWSLISDADSGEQSAANVLRLLKFSESSYTAFPHIKHMEEHGKRGDRILMKGLQTGGAIVTVKPVDPVYRHLPEQRVRVLVVANLQLSPSVVYILPHLTVTYKVELLKQGKAQEVKMPSKQYLLELDNKTVATLNSKTSTVTGIDFGFTELKLKDQTLQSSDTLREPSAGIYVVSPAYLEFTVNPDPNWLLETNRRYVVYVNVFDGENRKIYPSQNLRVGAIFPDRHFRVISYTTNGTYYVVETLHKGFVNLYAQLKSITTSNGKEYTFEKPVEGNQAVEIFDPIVLLPESVMLPWEPSGNNIQFQFKVSGGSGNYSWHSSNPSAADVQPTGLAIVGSTIGSITVKASDVRNAAHFDTSQVSVVPPSRLAFLPSKVEAEIGSVLNLPIALFGQLGNSEVRFDDCHTIELSILLSDSSIFRKKSVKESSTEHACADLELEATGVGHIEVTVAYEIGRIKLKASQVVAAYTPLTPFQPKEIAVVTLGSSLDIVFEGGPRPWVLDASGFFQTASFEKPKLVAVGKPRISDASKHHHSVSIRCSNFGEQLMTLTVGNKPTAKNPFPATSVATVTYACETPKGLHLFPLIEHPANLPPCPISAEFDDPVPVPLQTDVMMVAVLTDRLGRRFGNFSSLVVDWQVSDSNLGKFSNRLPTGMERKPLTTHLGYKWISLSDVGGLLTVTVQIDKYDSRSVDTWFSNKAVSPPIVKSRILRLVGYPYFSPQQVIMFNHVHVKALINIVQGSGHYKVDQNERASEIARINYNTDHKSNITVVPISEGSVVLSVADLCLSPMQSATATIFVSDIAQIVLQVVDKVELHCEVEVSVKVLDGNDLPIDSSYFSLMDVKPVSRSDIISVRQSLDSPSADRLTAVYTVRGESLGRAFLQVSAVSKMGHTIMSAAKEIQVFPPLHLKPKNITIIPGTFFQVMAFGGPQPESTIEFTIKNQTVATVTNNGLIAAVALGSTQIIAMATGLDASNSSRVVFSQDYAVVDVVELTEVRIVTPLKRIQAGTQMPVYAIGLNENVTPFSFANVAPPLSFRWLIANDQVALLRPVYHESGVDMSDEGNFAVRFHALSSGHVMLNLVVTSQHSRVATMKDSVMIQVFDHLSFLSPPISDGVILMMPSTEMFVKTNRDGSTAQLSYAVVDPDNSCTDRRPPVVSVSRSGLLTSGGYPGQAHLRVTAQEEFGVNHTMVILVKVKPLTYIMINTDTLIRTRVPGISSFPIGTMINFVVSLHDDVGEQFHATQSNIRYQINKYDQIQMLYGKTNNSLAARANSAGFTVLKVYEKSNPAITDYIGIPVDSAIHPSRSQVTLGSIVCFSSHLLTREGHMGEWVSSGDIITIDRTSGVAFANRIGSSYITYNVSYVATQTNLKVVPLTNISLKETASPLFLTNVETKDGPSSPSVQVVIENLELEQKAGLQGVNCSEMIRARGLESVDVSFFTCGIAFTESQKQFDINDIAHVAPTFDTATGHYNCRVTVTASEALFPLIASFEATLKLYAKVVAQEGQAELESESLVLPFHPAFYIQNLEIILTVNQATVNMRVVATESVLSEIEVISSDESLVRVRPPHSRSVPPDGVVRHFPVDLQLTSHMWNAAPTSVNVTVNCVLTGQSQVVVVGILRSDQAEMSWGHLLSALLHKHSNFFFLIICVVATISCIIIAYHLVYGQRYHYPGTGSQASAAFLSSSSSSRPQSPFTPAYPSQTPPSSSSQVRWTMDRSPYSNGQGPRQSRHSSQLPRHDKSF